MTAEQRIVMRAEPGAGGLLRLVEGAFLAQGWRNYVCDDLPWQGAFWGGRGNR